MTKRNEDRTTTKEPRQHTFLKDDEIGEILDDALKEQQTRGSTDAEKSPRMPFSINTVPGAQQKVIAEIALKKLPLLLLEIVKFK